MRGCALQDIIERRIPVPDNDEVFRAAPLVDAIDIDVRERFVQRIKRLLTVVLSAEQTLLFGGNGDEQNRAGRLRGQLRVGLRQFEQGRYARSVVDRAVVDLVPLQVGVAAQVIPVRRVNNELIGFLAFELRDHIARLNLTQCVGR